MTTTTTSGLPNSLTPEAVSEILSHPRRRTVVEVLSVYDEPIPLSNLAADVANRERTHQTPGSVLDRLERVQLQLYHQHLPKLADHGVIAFDTERRTVEAQSDLDYLTSFLDHVSGFD